MSWRWSLLALLLVGCEDWAGLQRCAPLLSAHGACVEPDGGGSGDDAGPSIDAGDDAGARDAGWVVLPLALSLPGRTPRAMLDTEQGLRLITTTEGGAGGYAEVLSLEATDSGPRLARFEVFGQGGAAPVLDAFASGEGSLVVVERTPTELRYHFDPPSGPVVPVPELLQLRSTALGVVETNHGPLAVQIPNESVLPFNGVTADGGRYGVTGGICFTGALNRPATERGYALTLTVAGGFGCPTQMVGRLFAAPVGLNGVTVPFAVLSDETPLAAAIARTRSGVVLAHTTERALFAQRRATGLGDAGEPTVSLTASGSLRGTLLELSAASVGPGDVVLTGVRDQVALLDGETVVVPATSTDAFENFVVHHTAQGWWGGLLDGTPVDTLALGDRYLIALDCRGTQGSCRGITGTVLVEVP